MTEALSKLRADVADDLARSGTSHLDVADRREFARDLVISRLRRLSSQRLTEGEAPLTTTEEQRMAKAVLDALFGLGRLQALVDDPSVENVDVNGCDRVWVTYCDGTKTLADPVADSDDELVEIIRSGGARFGLSERRFDHSHPELDLRLPDGSRLSALMSVTTRPSISIRRHRYVDLSLDDLVELGAMDEAMTGFLTAAVLAKKNIVVAGAMNSGKTTLVRALAGVIPPSERLVTIEQSFELGLDSMTERHPDMVALEARVANAEGEGEITMARLVRRALRMNADRVIVGEVLGDEVLPMLNAMSQGRSGSMCTIHADSSQGVFRRLASYALQAPERLPLEATNVLIAGSIHFIVFIDVVEAEVDRCVVELGSDSSSRPLFSVTRRRRFISSVREVIDADGLQVVSNEVFCPGPDRLAVLGAPLRPSTLEELVSKGFDPSDFRVATLR